jgi:hypothetical protein
MVLMLANERAWQSQPKNIDPVLDLSGLGGAYLSVSDADALRKKGTSIILRRLMEGQQNSLSGIVAICRGVLPWAPAYRFASAVRGAHGVTPLTKLRQYVYAVAFVRGDGQDSPWSRILEPPHY